MHSAKILIIEDEQNIANSIRSFLLEQGHRAEITLSGEEGFLKLNETSFDLLLLDIMLPGRNGLEILKTIRKKEINLPVLILTSKDSLEDRVKGLEQGADDYLIKPFQFPELLARIHALLRRTQNSQANQIPQVKLVEVVCDLSLNRVQRTVIRNKEEITLTNREFDLLDYLLKYKNEIVSRDMLARDVWKVNARITPIDNVIDVHIARLRKKIDHQSEQKLLETVRGLGFRIRSTQ